MAGLLNRLPLARSLRGRDSRALTSDAVAGLTVGVMLIPQGMAYAMLAGVPPVYGLYAALTPLMVYALLGTSRQLAVGPVATDSLLVASGVAPLALGDPDRYLALALLLAGLVGGLQLVMGFLRAGFLMNLLSRPVLAGFTSAAALIIGTSQLGNLFGIPIGRGRVHEILVSAWYQLGDAHPQTVAIGLTAILVGVTLKWWFPRLPSAMLLVAAGIFLSWTMSLGASGVEIVGNIPGGLPRPSLPGLPWAEISALFPVAAIIALVGFMEAMAVGRVYASKDRYDLDPNQELKALGSANLIGSIFQAFPVTGGFSRTAVNAQAGAKSQVSSLVSVGVLAITLLFLTPLFHHLPKAILAAIIVTAVATLVEVGVARELWKIDRRDFALMTATFAATLALGIKEGVVVGIGLSIVVVLDQIARPPIALLGRLPGTNQYRNISRHPDAITEEGIAVLRMDASLFYGNAESFKAAARTAFESTAAAGRPRFLVLDAYPMNRSDSTGIHTLRELVDEVRTDAGTIYMAGVKNPLRDTLIAGGIVDLIGTEHFFDNVWQAVEAATRARYQAD